MQLLRNVSIKVKLTLLTFTAVFVSLLLCGAAFLYNDVRALRTSKINQINTLADVLVPNSSLALETGDRASAQQTLAALAKQPEIDIAALYDSRRRVFASFPAGLTANSIMDTSQNTIEISRDITSSSALNRGESPPGPSKPQSGTQDSKSPAADTQDERVIGSIMIRASTADIASVVSSRAVMAFGVLIGSLAIGVGISQAFQRSITTPISNLVTAAKHVAQAEDYSYRVTKHGNDELGMLADAFNRMLGDVQDGQVAWQQINDELEQRVNERTAELKVANSEIKREMVERNQLQENLITASRQAGMAEIATGVLHNVGNVLNSVNVSANVLMEEIRDSSIGTLERVATIIDERSADLASFLTADPKGQHFPKLFRELTMSLAKQRDQQLQEINSLKKNIEHVKEVIARQQTYALVRGNTESVDVIELMEDSLKMVEASLLQNKVDIEKDFQKDIEIVTEKHKVMQILINLMSNARNALTEYEVEDKRMILTVIQLDQEVLIEVADNGIGISAENVKKIFTHGFTTRKQGHGFGLHSCANAATELGGSLSVQSEGEGRGATFSLRLPLEFRRDTEADHSGDGRSRPKGMDFGNSRPESSSWATY